MIPVSRTQTPANPEYLGRCVNCSCTGTYRAILKDGGIVGFMCIIHIYEWILEMREAGEIVDFPLPFKPGG